MKNLVETLSKRFYSTGHFLISIEKDGKELKTVTTNTMAIDAAFDPYYDEDDNNNDRYYKSSFEAKKALVDEILRNNEI